MLDIPILRGGRPYLSKETLELRDYASGEPVARLSLANPGLISRDLLHDAWTPLQEPARQRHSAHVPRRRPNNS